MPSIRSCPGTFLSTLSLRRATNLMIDHAKKKIFLSTLSLRRATNSTNTDLRRHRDFYPRSPCGERQPTASRNNKHNMISIHALLAESDASNQTAQQAQHISIHALLAESDGLSYFYIIKITNFYPRSPCGERLGRAEVV